MRSLRWLAALVVVAALGACGKAGDGEECEKTDDCEDGLTCQPVLCVTAPCPSRCGK